MTTFTTFPPLQNAVVHAESWANYLSDVDRENSAVSPDDIVGIGIHIGELLPFLWRMTFHFYFRRGDNHWASAKEFDAIRQEVRRLFFTAREAMERSRTTAKSLQTLTENCPKDFERLVKAIEDTGRLEEAVFRDWSSFVESASQTGETLDADASLAETLGITVEEAHQRLEARRRELHAKKE